jgi:hypothetical protein
MFWSTKKPVYVPTEAREQTGIHTGRRPPIPPAETVR